MKPKKVSNADIVFGGNINELLPDWKSIPDEFKRDNHPWVKEFERIFFQGGSVEQWQTKDGIDRRDAILHFKAVAHSWEPKHEHKTAGCAYLLSQWFTLKGNQ